MPEFQNYAGTLANVQRVAKNLNLGGGGRLQNVPGPDVTEFIHDADEIINSKLGIVFQTPLVQITRDGDTFFPHPIPNIARRIAASLLVQSVYSEIDQNASDNAQRFGEQAVAELEALSYGAQRGTRHLEGQKLLSKNNFANPRVVPRENMPSPRQAL